MLKSQETGGRWNHECDKTGEDERRKTEKYVKENFFQDRWQGSAQFSLNSGADNHS